MRISPRFKCATSQVIHGKQNMIAKPAIARTAKALPLDRLSALPLSAPSALAWRWRQPDRIREKKEKNRDPKNCDVQQNPPARSRIGGAAGRRLRGGHVT